MHPFSADFWLFPFPVCACEDRSYTCKDARSVRGTRVTGEAQVNCVPPCFTSKKWRSISSARFLFWLDYYLYLFLLGRLYFRWWQRTKFDGETTGTFSTLASKELCLITVQRFSKDEWMTVRTKSVSDLRYSSCPMSWKLLWRPDQCDYTIWLCLVSMRTQNISSFIHHIKYLDPCMEY
jgi:hypothetical protein